jgi:predicted phage terminase large subunit-like protein
VAKKKGVRQQWEEALKTFFETEDAFSTLSFREFVDKVYPRYKWYRHCIVLANVLQRVADGELKRVMVFMPPRHGKTILVSKLFPAYLLYRCPHLWVGLNSYAAELSYTFSRAARDAYSEIGGKMREDAAAIKNWETPEGGGCWAAGVGGPITGKGFGSCFPSGTKVVTEWGRINIETLYQLKTPPRVLSFNHETGRLEWRQIIAASVRPAKSFVEITLHSGSKLRCTPEHPIFNPELGYREASAFVSGQAIIQVKSIQVLRSVWSGDRAQRNLSKLLSSNSGLSVSHEMRLLQQGIRETEIRNRQGTKTWLQRVLLWSRVQSNPSQLQKSQTMQVRSANRNQNEPILPGLSSSKLRSSPKSRFLEAATKQKLRILWQIFSTYQQSFDVLFKNLSEQSALCTNERDGKQSLQRWNKLCRLVSQNAASYFRKGWRSLCCQRLEQRHDFNQAQTEEWWIPNEIKTCDSPYRLPTSKQLATESSHLVLGVPQKPSQANGCWQIDTVSAVRELCTAGESVYDIQVEGNSNFFANGILVHNSGIIDDPLKNAKEALSATIKRGHQDWYSSTFYTRAEPDAPIMIVMTRWAEDDLAGWQLSQESEDEPECWHIVNFEAIKEEYAPKFPPNCTVEPDWRRPGEALCPERFDIAKLTKIKKRLGEYFWNALYQQRPSPLEGSHFKRSWWQYYKVLPSDFDMVIQSWDCTFKDTNKSDFVVGQVWGKRGGQFYLIDQVRDRMDFPTTIAAIRALSAKYPNAGAKLVEDKANGPAVISSLEREIPGIIAIEPEGGKLVRAVAIAPFVEAGNVFLPDPSIASWVGDYVGEFSTFPNGANDDMCDSTSQAINWLASKVTYWAVSHDNAWGS